MEDIIIAVKWNESDKLGRIMESLGIKYDVSMFVEDASRAYNRVALSQDNFNLLKISMNVVFVPRRFVDCTIPLLEHFPD
jgi:hypothetical protein